jgi:GAF domain-containing protein
MNQTQAAIVKGTARHSTETSASDGAKDTRLSGRALIVARLLFVVVTLLVLLVFVSGVPSAFDKLLSGVIGIELRQSGAGEFVMSPAPGLPAAQAGIQEGDILIAVNGFSLPPGTDESALLRLLRGRPGTQVTLEVRSPEGSTRSCDITRAGYPFERFHISADVYALLLTTLGVALVVGSCIPAAIIFLRKSDDWVALLVSVTIVNIAIYNSAANAGLSLLPSPFYEAMSVAYNLSVLVILFIFPNGRFVPRWTRVFLLVGGAWILWKTLPIQFGATLRTTNLWIVIDLMIFGTAILAQIYRYRRVSGPRERQQTKWITYGMAVACLGQYAYYLPLNLLPALSERTTLGLGFSLIGNSLRHLALLVLPVAVTHSVLRRRLYDIDFIINRTLVYLPLSAIMVGTFAALTTLLKGLFVALTGQSSDLAVVLTTLIVAASVAPIKDHVEALVDKYFKEEPGPEAKLNAFEEQIQKRIGAVDAGPITRRLLDEAVKAFDAECGIAYLNRNGETQTLHTIGEWKGEGKMSVPLHAGGRNIASITLGARRSGSGYSDRDREALHHVAQVVSQAIEEDTRAGTP